MDISKQTKKYLLQIIAFGIILFCAMEHFDVVIRIALFLLGIVMPFIIGGTIAFILNVPMKSIEKNLFQSNVKLNKLRRPLAFVITLLCIIGVLILALLVVIPELGRTLTMLMTQIPIAFMEAQKWVLEITANYPSMEEMLAGINIDWTSISNTAVKFVQSIAFGLVNSGFGLFSGIISGVVTAVIGFTFSIYILFQKEKLSSQAKQIFYALFPDKVTDRILYIGSLSNQVFSGFLSGQCLEAAILGTLFVIAMTIFQMPYAMLIGIVIAVTALIPVVGSFIGCAVGMFLIVMVNPIQAIWFLILFLVLQQIEGNLIYPHVVGSSIGLPSIWVLVAVTLGGNLLGIVGILLFIPLCSDRKSVV